MQTASRSLQPFLQGSLGVRPTVRLTDHATWSVTIGGMLLSFYNSVCFEYHLMWFHADMIVKMRVFKKCY